MKKQIYYVLMSVILCLLFAGLAMAEVSGVVQAPEKVGVFTRAYRAIFPPSTESAAKTDCVGTPGAAICRIEVPSITVDCAKYSNHTDCLVEYLNRTIREVPGRISCNNESCILQQAYRRVRCATYRDARDGTRVYTDCYVEYYNGSIRQVPGKIICNNNYCILHKATGIVKQAPTIDCAKFSNRTDCLVEYLNRTITEVPGKISCDNKSCILQQAYRRVRCATYRDAGDGTRVYTDCYVEYYNSSVRSVPGIITCNNNFCILHVPPGLVRQAPTIDCATTPNSTSCIVEKAPGKVNVFVRFYRVFFPLKVVQQTDSSAGAATN